MSVRIAPGWEVRHLTDRTIELRKQDVVYRRFTGRDGFVLVRAEPGMTRDQLITTAIQAAERTDHEMSLRIGKQLMPSVGALERYRRQQRQWAPVMGVPGQEPSERVYKS